MTLPVVFANLAGPIPLSDLDLNFNALASGTGAANVGFTQAGTGAVAQTVQTKLQLTVDASDYGVVADGVTNDAPALTLAIADLGVDGGVINLPVGTLAIGTPMLVTAYGVRLVGKGFSDKGATGAAARGATCLLRTFTGASPMLVMQGDASSIDLVDLDGDLQGAASGAIFPDNLVVVGSRFKIGKISSRNASHDGVRFGMTTGQLAAQYGVNAGANNTNGWSFDYIFTSGNQSRGVHINDTNANTSTNYPVGTPNVNGATGSLIDATANKVDGVGVGNAQDITLVHVTSQANGVALTFTVAPVPTATSGALTAPWALPSGVYPVQFVETSGGLFECRYVTLTNAATTATWTGGLAANCNAAAGTGSGLHFYTDGTNSGPRCVRVIGNDIEENLGYDVLTDFATLPVSNPGLYNVVLGNRGATLNSRWLDNSTGGLGLQWSPNYAVGAYSFGPVTNISNPVAGGIARCDFYADTGFRRTGSVYSSQSGAKGVLGFQTYGSVLADRFVIDRDQQAYFNGLASGVLFNKTAADTTTPGVAIEGSGGRIDIVNSGTGTTVVQTFYNGSGQVGVISTNGSATSYATTSDARLKTAIVTMPDQSAAIDAMRPCQYEFKAAPGVKMLGFIAQELVSVAPAAVHVGGGDPATDPWSVDYSQLVPLLVLEIQSLRRRLAALEE